MYSHQSQCYFEAKRKHLVRPILSVGNSMAGGINQEQACVTLNLCEGIVTCTSRLGQWLNKMNLPVREGFPLTMMPMAGQGAKMTLVSRI